MAAREKKVLVSSTGVELAREVAWRFRITDVTPELEEQLLSHAGAARLAFNQCLGWVKTTLEWRWWETEVLGMPEGSPTPRGRSSP